MLPRDMILSEGGCSRYNPSLQTERSRGGIPRYLSGFVDFYIRYLCNVLKLWEFANFLEIPVLRSRARKRIFIPSSPAGNQREKRHEETAFFKNISGSFKTFFKFRKIGNIPESPNKSFPL